MKLYKISAVATVLALILGACTSMPNDISGEDPSASNEAFENATAIELGDNVVKVNGNSASTSSTDAVYTANDIVYYKSGMDFTYGEGTENDAHSEADAAAHTVVHIAKPGVYTISGKLSRGQIAVDLGEDAENDENAVVTLILNGVDITCKVAPAIIFYNVYECGSDDADTATKDVDTSAAGANVIIADGTVNTVDGAYVARIYKPDSVVLTEDGTEVEDAKKLHKYDAALYSKMSMNVSGGTDGSGVLNIIAANEGLDSELHLTVNGGNVNILSGNDGINTNEDGVSVTTINGGTLNINVTGTTGEGDGIDSNGWLVINGGTVIAAACSNSADAGIDSDMGIHINGGTVMASGHMLDRIEGGSQTYAVWSFKEKQNGEAALCLKDENNETVFEFCPTNNYTVFVYSSPDLKEGTYTLWSDGVQLAGQSGGGMYRPGGMQGFPGMNGEGEMPPEFVEGMDRPWGEMPDGEMPEGMGHPEDMERPEGMEPPEGAEMPEGIEPPTDGERPTPPEGQNGRGDGKGFGGGAAVGSTELSPEFIISTGANMFGGVCELK